MHYISIVAALAFLNALRTGRCQKLWLASSTALQRNSTTGGNDVVEGVYTPAQCGTVMEFFSKRGLPASQQ